MGMNLGSAGKAKGGPSAEINITPLIDVVLVLLIIFMVLVPSTLKRLTAALPQKDHSTTPAQTPPDQIVVKVGIEAQVFVNDEPVEPAAFKQKLATRLRSSGGKVVFFDIHDDARYGAVVRYMDLARGAGAATLALVSGLAGKP